MGTVCLPWTERHAFDRPTFDRAVDAVAPRVDHLYVFGTAGEGHAVSSRQFHEVTRAFVEATARHDCRPMVGIISTSMSETVDRIDAAWDLGVDRFQVSLPSWGACTESEAFDFVAGLCGRSPRARFMLYDVKRSGRLLSAEEYGRLHAALPNLVAAKLAGTTAERAAAVQAAAPGLRLFLTEKAFAEASALGLQAGLLASYATLHWGRCRAFYEAGVAGDARRLASDREEMSALLSLMRQSVDPEPHMDGAFDQMFLKRHVPEFPLRLLPPYRSMSDAAFDRFMGALAGALPSWWSGPAAERSGRGS